MNLPNVSNTKKTDQDAAELETEKNRGQMAHVSDDKEMQRFLELLLAPASNSDSESASDIDTDSRSDDETLFD